MEGCREERQTEERAEQKRTDSLRRWLKDGGKFSGKSRRETRKYKFFGEIANQLLSIRAGGL